MKKVCPKCGKTYAGLENFCVECGLTLVREANRCSEEKTALCKGKNLPETDKFCAYCGAPTTYALGMMDGKW